MPAFYWNDIGMGFFSDFQAKRAAKRVQRDADRAAQVAKRAAVTHATALVAWQEDVDELAAMIDLAQAGSAGTRIDDLDTGIVLKKGEAMVAVYEKAVLIEPRRQPGHYTGGYQGFSFRVAKGMRYNVGGSRGKFVPGNELPTSIDVGKLAITTQRVVFQGANSAREWAFAKMLGMTHDEAHPITTMAVSNRQKVSGIGYDQEHCAALRFRLELARAIFQGDTQSLVKEMQGELSVLKTKKPVAPAAPALPPAGPNS